MWPFKKKDVFGDFNKPKSVTISGVRFLIKKIEILDYLEGAKLLFKTFDTYKVSKSKSNIDTRVHDIKKARDFMQDVILAGCVKPKFVRKEEDEGILIDELFTDWQLAQKVVLAILAHTTGKKKLV